MANETEESAKAKVIKANYMLQAKVGAGPLDENVLEECQKVIDNNEIDFTALGMQFLDELSAHIEQTKSGSLEKDAAIEKITATVMQLKANAATFKYTLITDLANIMLSFLEGIKEIDENAVEIVEAHHKTLRAIVVKQIQGDGGQAGKEMQAELQAVCKRYFAQKS